MLQRVQTLVQLNECTQVQGTNSCSGQVHTSEGWFGNEVQTVHPWLHPRRWRHWRLHQGFKKFWILSRAHNGRQFNLNLFNLKSIWRWCVASTTMRRWAWPCWTNLLPCSQTRPSLISKWVPTCLSVCLLVCFCDCLSVCFCICLFACDCLFAYSQLRSVSKKTSRAGSRVKRVVNPASQAKVF